MPATRARGRGTKSGSTRAASKPGGRRWTQYVTTHSNALDLEPGVFTLKSPREVALSLRRSAEKSDRRKASSYGSAMSMLTFYINRAGKGLSRTQKDRLMHAKDELRKLYGKPAPGVAPKRNGDGGIRRPKPSRAAPPRSAP
ncbi:MAG TPA: DUF3175 domain-containing protein [Thermoanaerobaculia bacterium]|nr:DUF3175 domain-containing protein [Thermoanaerobaculia bacterium]